MPTASYTFEVEGRPIPKGRPRLGRRGRVFTPQTTLDREAAIAAAYRGPIYDGSVCVTIDYWADGEQITITPVDWVSTMRGDLDNYQKTSFDGLQAAGAFANDKQVHESWTAKH